jgi:hypothetical protein
VDLVEVGVDGFPEIVGGDETEVGVVVESDNGIVVEEDDLAKGDAEERGDFI